jgi:hypothetical protein
MRTGKRWNAFGLVLISLTLSAMACALISAEALNDGKGTREDPVPARVYARTTDYEVRALSVVWSNPNDSSSTDPQNASMRVQFQIRCDAADREVCPLAEIAGNIKLVDAAGILYDSVLDGDLEKPLEGEILGEAEKTGWLAYQVPRGVEICCVVALYDPELSVFFDLPIEDN